MSGYSIYKKRKSFIRATLTKKIAKVRVDTIVIGLILAVIGSPLAVLAKSGVDNTPPNVVVAPTYSVRIATTDVSDTTISLSGSVYINNFPEKENLQYIKFIWGDGQTDVDKVMNLDTYLKSSKLLTAPRWTRSHTYAVDGVRTVTVRIYHGSSTGAETYPADSAAYTIETENTLGTCTDGANQDRDVFADLKDSDCFKFKVAENTPALCSDNYDNDDNGKTDLRDANCAPFIPTENDAVTCADGIDNDLDGKVDLADTSCAAFIPTENDAVTCADGIDNDLDGKVDLYDAGCATFRPEENTAELCTDGVDNDFDGMKDGADADCAGLTPTENTAETCLDAVDNDFDGKVDWNDSDCAQFVVPCPVGFFTFFVPGVGNLCGATAGY